MRARGEDFKLSGFARTPVLATITQSPGLVFRQFGYFEGRSPQADGGDEDAANSV